MIVALFCAAAIAAFFWLLVYLAWSIVNDGFEQDYDE